MSALSVHDLCKHYRNLHALDGLTLEVGEGEMLALLGHNGAGKTTLMKLLLGLTRPTSGEITLLGAPPGPHHRKHIGFLPENVSFSGGMKGREVLRFYARLKGASLDDAETLLDRVGLSDAAHKPVRTYSKGMRQRLGLAQALLGHPRLLLLDEPTTGLDPVLRQAFYGILRDLRDAGTTVLISSHVLTELELRAERIAILSHGRLVACDTLDGLRRHADLPVRIRAVKDGTERRLEVRPEEKMAAIRQLAMEPVDDLEVIPPSLEDIYTHYGAETDRADTARREAAE